MASSTVLSTLMSTRIGQVSRRIGDQVHDAFVANWYLGFTAFGGPPVHFQIVG
jgi:hypothetical protein